MTTVAELLGSLGLDVDFESIAKAQSALNHLREDTERATDAAKLSAALKHVHGDATQAAGLIRVSYDEVALAAEKAKKRQEAWGKATEAWGKATRFAVYAVGTAVAAVYSISRLGAIGDEYTGAASKIRGLTEDVEQQKQLQDRLFQSAQNTATGYADVVGLYQQVAKAAQASGRSLEQGAEIVDTINKAIKASGAPAEGARAALTQLAQALGSGKLRGEEFNSIIEQAPFLIDIVATSLGKTRGEMRKLAEAGQLTSKVVLRALEQQKGAVDDAFAKRLPQVSDMFVRLRNTVSKELAAAFQDRDVVEGLTDGFRALTKVLVFLIRVFAGLGSFLARHPAVMWTIVAAVGAIQVALWGMSIAATIAWIATLSPAIIAAGVIAAVVVVVLALAIAFRKQLGGAAIWAWEKLKALGRGTVAIFTAIGSAIRGAFIGTVNWVIDKINWLINKVNWVIRKMNKLPGVDIGTIDTIDHVGRKKTAVTAPAQGRSGNTTVTQTVHQTNHISGGDPVKMREAAKQGAKEALDDAARGAKKGRGK